MTLTIIETVDESTAPPSPERLRRLAATAMDLNIHVIETPRADGGIEATAIDGRFKSRRFTVTAFSCECATFVHVGACVHHARLLAARGWLPS